jgi:calcium-dependent protein kinase
MAHGGKLQISNESKLESKYDVGKKVVGEGAYGTVRKAKNLETGQYRAVKTIHKKLVKNMVLLEREIGIMRVSDHPNIIKLVETFEDKRSYYLVMELCEGGELFDRIVSKKYGFTEKVCAVVIKQMLLAANYLHINGFAHRDIKPENFLLLEDKDVIEANLKLVDFGLSKPILDTKGKNQLKTKAGTPMYMAPEILTGEYDEKVDVWAVGVTLYVLLCGQPPFPGRTDKEILASVKSGRVNFSGSQWSKVSDLGKAVVSLLLDQNPTSRPTTAQALQHTWFVELAATDNAQLSALACESLQEYAKASQFKRAALYVIAKQLADSQISDLKTVFMTMDENNDGTLSIAEVKEGLTRAGFPEPKELDSILNSVDSDGSGVIDYTEFMAATLDRQRYMQEDVCWRAFRVFDKDGSGSITKTELREALQDGEVEAMMDYDEAELDKIILDADKNGDGQIDFEEFFAMMQEGTRMRKEGRSDTYTDLVGVNGLGPTPEGMGRSRASFSMANFIFSNVGQLQGKYAVSKKVVGEGSYGTVRKCKNKATNTIRAIKTIQKSYVKDVNVLKSEINVMKSLDHPNIIKLFETFEDRRSYYLIMELCTGGELFDRIVEEKNFTEKVCAVVVQQMLRAVNYMHSTGYVHRDIKPENWLLLTAGPVAKTPLKMVDFGLSKQITKGMSTKAGTPMYMAPEVLTGSYSELVDVWSVGVVMYIMLSGRPPFAGKDETTILKNVKKADIPYDAKGFDKVSPAGKKMLQSLLSREPESRPSAVAALGQSWFKDLIDTEDSALSSLAVESLKEFAGMGKLKKAALFVIATQLKDNQIEDLKQFFLGMDADASGTLTPDEIKKGFENAGLKAPKELEELLKNIDNDGSGEIDYMEFIAATMDRQKYVQEDVCWQAFKTFDLDGSGTITKDEMMQVFRSGAVSDVISMPASEVDKLIQEADLNGDGEIDFEEFMAMIAGSKEMQEGLQKSADKNKSSGGKKKRSSREGDIGMKRSSKEKRNSKDDGKKSRETKATRL